MSLNFFLTFIILFAHSSLAMRKVYFIEEEDISFFKDAIPKERFNSVTTISKNQNFSSIVYDYLGNYYSLDLESVHQQYQKLNPHIENFEMIRVGQKIKHPNFIKAHEFLNFTLSPSWNSSSSKKTRSRAPANSLDRFKRNIYFSTGVSFSKLLSKNKLSNSQSKLISSGDFLKGIVLEVGTDRDTYRLSLVHKAFEYKAPRSIGFDSSNSNLFHYSASYSRKLNTKIDLGFYLGYGSDYFQTSQSGSITHNHVNTLKYGVLSKFQLMKNRFLSLDTSIRYGLQNISSADLNFSSSSEYEGKFNVTFPIGERFKFGLSIFYIVETKETDSYHQEINSNGLMFNFGFWF